MSAAPALQAECFGTYDDIAQEYYEAARHPTCASLRELSCNYLAPRLARLSGKERLLVEVGVGKSVAAPIWSSLGVDLGSVILLDSSRAMISYSAEWGSLGAQLWVADATATQLESGSVDILVSSLGDPYNCNAFWSEVARILRPGGICHFTTPAYEWATTFRAPNCRSAAEFVRSGGEVLLLPSPVFSPEGQVQLFYNAGLSVVEAQSLTLSDLSTPAAPKLLCVSEDDPVVRGYSVSLAPPS